MLAQLASIHPSLPVAAGFAGLIAAAVAADLLVKRVPRRLLRALIVRDWVEIPSYGANDVVIEIGLHTGKHIRVDQQPERQRRAPRARSSLAMRAQLRRLVASIVWPLLATGASAQDDFPGCLARLERDARDQGITGATIDEVFATIAPRPRVIEADRSQPEFIDTFRDYLTRRVNERRVRIGREHYDEQRAFLDALTNRYGVPGQYVLAIWALESDFGNAVGDVSVFDALSTLACDGRRSEYFSAEFVSALELAAGGHVPARRMVGSWAGAMGYTQFMPSNYLRHAVDGDGDGRIDLWSDRDALASAAHYMQQLGWQPGWRWGREVMLPDGFDYSLTGRDQPRPLSAWAALGVTDVAGRSLQSLETSAALLVPAGSIGPAFLVYGNFDVIMGWNRSEYFALTVGHLADRIAGGAELTRPPPVAQPLERADAERLQRYLDTLGYDVGPIDGQLGTRSRAAVRALQRDRGLVADGYVDHALLDALGLSNTAD